MINPFKVNLVQSQDYTTTTITQFQSIFIIPEGKLYALSSYFLFLPTPSPWQQPVYSLYRFTYSGYFIYMESHNIIFYIWLVSLGIMFSRFLHIVAYISTSFLSVAE